MTDDLIIRKLELTDNLCQVAHLIYYTDDYVFPYLYKDDINRAEDVIINMIKGDTIYNYKNITAAILDGEIVGIVVSKETPISVNLGEMVRCFIDANEPIDEHFTKTFNEYYKLFENEPEGIYIANVCVDKRYRGRGIGKRMMIEFMKELDGEVLHLEAVKDNVSALKLYQSLGFEIVYEYPGFVDVPCYRMIRK